MPKILKWSLLSVLAVVLAGGIIGYRMYTRPHRNVREATAIPVPADQLATAYESNEPDANSRYLDKVLEVNGQVSEITKNQKGETVIALKGTDLSNVRCTIEGICPDAVKTGSAAVLKGICTGYLSDVVLVRCIPAGN